MSSSYIFTGSGFFVQAVTAVTANKVRVTYSNLPVRTSGAGPTDSLNANRYSLPGRTIGNVEATPNDSRSVDLVLTEPLTTGTWTVTVSGVLALSGASLSSPTSGTFAFSALQTSLVAGHEEEDGASVIRKHLNAFLAGPKWDALIAALGQADDYIWELAQNALKQLSLWTAEGSFLRKRAGDFGIQEYPGLGLSDDQFRDLAIKLSTGKVTYLSILEILEAYYGMDALRAYVDSDVGPFSLTDGQTLVISNGTEEYTYTIYGNSFQDLSQVPASELSVALNTFFINENVELKALAKTNANGDLYVRIYSDELGLKSKISVVGGTAQRILNFSTYKDVYTGSVVPADAYSWVYTLNTEGKTVLTLSTVGIPKINTASVKAGDYLVIGPDTATAGWYQVDSASYTYSGNYIQTVVLTENIGYTGTILQQSSSSYRYYTPTVKTIQSNNRSVVVSQTVDGILDIEVPATLSLDRDDAVAAYIAGNEAVDIFSIERKNGVVTVQTEQNHGLTAGQQVEIRDFVATGRPWVVPSNGTNLGGSFLHSLASTSAMPSSGISASSPGTVQLSTGTLVIAGGWDATGVPYNKSFSIVLANTTIGGASQAVGAIDTTYTTTALGNLVAAKYDGGISALLGPMLDQVVFSGGYDNTETITAACQKLTGSTWAAIDSMERARALHGQVTIDDQRVLATGGMATPYEATAACEVYQPLLNAWINTGSMAQARAMHNTVKMSDGNVLVFGGFAPGQPTSISLPNLKSYWKFDEISGLVCSDEMGLFSLTTTVSAVTAVGKVGNCIDVTAGGYPTYPSDNDLQNVFLMTNGVGMTAEGWVKGLNAGGNRAILIYQNSVAAGEVDNTIFALYDSSAGAELGFTWEKGSNVTVNTISAPYEMPASSVMDDWYHVAVVGTVIPGSQVTYTLYVNGINIGDVTGDLPTGGGNSYLSFGNSPLGSYLPWTDKFDDWKIWTRPLSPYEIREQFLQGAGYLPKGTNRIDAPFMRTMRPLNSVEKYTASTGTWSSLSNMGTARGLAQAILLDNDEVLVLGGLGYENAPYALFSGLNFYWPNHTLATAEIYNYATDTWRRITPMPVPRSQFWATKIGNRVYVGGLSYDKNAGETAPSDETVCWLDLTKMKWHVLPATARRRTWAIGQIVGGSPTSDLTYMDAIVGDSPRVSAAEINGIHQIATIVSPTAFTFETAEQTYASNLGHSELLQTSGSTYAFTNPKAASRTSNVTTVTVTVPENTYAVFINSTDANFSSGLKVLTARTATTISYAEAAANNTGTVYVSAPARSVNPTSTEVDSTDVEGNGMFVIDPTRFTERSINTTLSSELLQGSAYSVLTVAATTDFPDEEGWLVIGIGTEYQTKPLKFLEKISLNEILMQGFTAEMTIPAGTRVSLVQLTPESYSDAWITGTSLGQIAAQKDVSESVANDIQLNWSVIYPGDRGLGGEGASNSDDSFVWGPDNFDSGED